MKTTRAFLLVTAAAVGLVSCGEDSSKTAATPWLVGDWTTDSELAAKELPPLTKPISEVEGADSATGVEFYWNYIELAKKSDSPLRIRPDHTVSVMQRGGVEWKWEWAETEPGRVHLKFVGELPPELPRPDHWIRRDGDRIRMLPEKHMVYKYDMPMKRL